MAVCEGRVGSVSHASLFGTFPGEATRNGGVNKDEKSTKEAEREAAHEGDKMQKKDPKIKCEPKAEREETRRGTKKKKEKKKQDGGGRTRWSMNQIRTRDGTAQHLHRQHVPVPELN